MLFSKKDLQKLIIPLMFEQLLAVSVGMVDTLMVSQAGEAAISGVALVDNINRLIIQVMAALATGGAVVCSQFVGKGKEEGAKKSGAQLETVLLVFFCLYDTAFFNRNERAAACGIRKCVRRCYGQCSALFYGNIAVVPVFRHLQCGGCDI